MLEELVKKAINKKQADLILFSQDNAFIINRTILVQFLKKRFDLIDVLEKNGLLHSFELSLQEFVSRKVDREIESIFDLLEISIGNKVGEEYDFGLFKIRRYLRWRSECALYLEVNAYYFRDGIIDKDCLAAALYSPFSKRLPLAFQELIKKEQTKIYSEWLKNINWE